MKNSIIFCTHEFSPFRGGVATYVEELGLATAKLGYFTEIWTLGPPSPVSPKISSLKIHRFGGKVTLKLPGILRLSLGIFRHFSDISSKSSSPPCLVLSSYGAILAALFLFHLRLLRPSGPRQNCEIGIIFHGSEIPKIQSNSLLSFWITPFLKQARFLATTSHYTAKVLSERLYPLCSLSSDHPPVVLPCALPSKFTTFDLSQYPNSTPPPINILTLARIHPRKGQLECAQALGQLPPALKSKICYQIAGIGDETYLQKIKQVCDTKGVPYTILGEIKDSDLAQTYQNAHIYAMTSQTLPKSIEGFGITYLEASFFSLPVIGFDTGGVKEAVLHNQTGILIPEGNITQLSQAFEKLISDPDLRAKMGKAGSDHALSFQWKKTAKLLAQTLDTH